MKFVIITIFSTILSIASVSGESLSPKKPLIKHEVQFNNHPFAVYEKRAAQPENVIVLIHGRTISALPNFDLHVGSKNKSFMDALVESGFNVYAIDLRGFGNTPRDQSGWNTPEKAASDVKEFLKWVANRHPQNSKPSLFGYSLGSLVSHLVVQKSPELVSDLILFGHPISYLNKIKQRSKDDDQAPVKHLRKPNSVEWSSDGFILESTTQAVIDAYVVACLKADPVLVDWDQIQQWRQLDPAKVSTSTLLINGIHDPHAPVETLSPFFKKIKSADKAWVIISKCGHNVHLEDGATRLVNGVVNFIRRKQRSPR